MIRILALTAALLPLSAKAVDLREYPDLNRFISRMATEHKFEPDELRRWFEQAEIRPEIIEAMERPREALPWWQYKKTFLTEENARRGVAYWEKNGGTLEQAAKEYGVPAEIIVAIIGVETQFGRHTGRYPVIDALTTLAFRYPARGDYFRRELEEFLLLTREQGLNPLAMKGSYAGAIGIGQFMPSSYRAYAVDFDKDKTRNLMASTEDAIGSIANYFQKHGWRTGEPVVGQVRAGTNLYTSLDAGGLEHVSVKQLRKYGILANDNIGANESVNLIRLEEEDGALYLLAFHNFGVINRYNRSHHYALAVYELSQMIRTRYLREPKFPLGPDP